jgi:HNH endonuclease
MKLNRNQTEARRIARNAYPYPGCCLCGQSIGVELAHLDHNSENNDPDNLAWLCRHHHWMFDVGLFAIEAVKLQRAYWQAAKGTRTNAYMKDAGRKAAATRAKKGIGRELALKAVATRRARATGSGGLNTI